MTDIMSAFSANQPIRPPDRETIQRANEASQFLEVDPHDPRPLNALPRESVQVWGRDRTVWRRPEVSASEMTERRVVRGPDAFEVLRYALESDIEGLNFGSPDTGESSE